MTIRRVDGLVLNGGISSDRDNTTVVLDIYRTVPGRLLLFVGEQLDNLVVENRVDEESVATIVHVHQVLTNVNTPLET